MELGTYESFIHQSRYARYVPEFGRRETWKETVSRYCGYWESKFPDSFPYDRVFNAIYNMEVMPSMRALMTAGKALDRDNMAGFNCSYAAIDDLRAFDEILYILMCGTGVGFSVERQSIVKLPILPEAYYKVEDVIVVRDSKGGWADALRKYINYLYAGQIPIVDTTKLRPEGAPLKTFGGRSSGPAPFRKMLTDITRIITAAHARRLTSVECHDIVCVIAAAVVVGGVRRSALISLSNLTDERMRRAKSGDWREANGQRQLANNSVAYTEKPDIGIFMAEWLALYDSKSGERGIFNRVSAERQAAMTGRRELGYDWGTNPCLTGDTVIATLNGPKTFKELADGGKDVQVFSWHPESKLPVVRWMRRPHKTASNVPTLRIEFDSGLVVNATPNHSFYNFRGGKIKAVDLKVGQSVRAWSMSKHRDGHLRVHAWDSDTNSACHQWVHRMVWEAANGEIPDNCIVHHKDENTENNDLANLEMITSVEHNVLHYPKRFANGFDGTCANHKVVSISSSGFHDVYNGCVDDSHTYVIVDPVSVAGVQSGIISANCGEIILRPNGLCNLSEVIVRDTDTEETLMEKIEIATIIGTYQSTLTNFRYVRKVWQKNAEEERLLGVSMTGIMDNNLINGQTLKGVELNELLERLKGRAIETNSQWAKRLGIPVSAAITTVKPSGTVSQLTDSASGIHPRFAPYYIRNVRNSRTDPISDFMVASSVPHETDNLSESTLVFSFPKEAPKDAIYTNDVTAVEQLNHYLSFKRHWCEHNPSITIYVKEDEWLDIAAIVYREFDDIGGVSFLPFDGGRYEQMPYTEVTEAEYNKALDNFPDVDWDKFIEGQDNVVNTKELACVAGYCEI